MGHRSRTALALLFVGCGSGVSPEHFPVSSGTGGGAATETSFDSRASPPPACEAIESASSTPTQSCASPTVVIGAAGTVLTPRARGLLTYGFASIIATGDTSHPQGDDLRNAPWVDGDDVSVAFQAPRGGKWRLSARGPGAHRIVATRSCSAPSPNRAWERTFNRSSDSWIATGAELTTEVALELFAERDERFDVVVDGCPRGSRCSFSLRAERLSDLACAAGNPCAENDECFIDRCDAERYSCVSKDRLRQVAPGHARAWKDGGTLFVAGIASNWPKHLPPLRRFIRYELLDGNGTVAPHAWASPFTTLTDGWYPPSQVHLYPSEVRSIRMSFAESEYGPVSGPTTVIAIGAPTQPRPLGASCVPGDAVEPCEAGECSSSGPNAFVCALPSVRLTEAAGYSQVFDSNGLSTTGPIVFLDLVGNELTPEGWSAVVRDAMGVELVSGEVRCDYSEPRPRSGTRIGCVMRVEPELPGRVSSVRLSRTTLGMSLVRDVPVIAVPTVGYGEACGTRGRFPYLQGEVGRCDEGLRCAGGLCAFPEEWVCSGAAISTWAPATFPSTITGATSGSEYSRSCGGPSQLLTELDFVAPDTGAYAFTITGSATATVAVGCSTRGCTAQPLSVGPIALERGSRARVRVSTSATTPTFSIRAERSPP